MESYSDAAILEVATPQIENTFLVRQIPIKYLIERENYELEIKVIPNVIPTLQIEVISRNPGQELFITTENYNPKYFSKNVTCYGRFSNAETPKSIITFQWSVFNGCREKVTAPELVLRIAISDSSSRISEEAIPFSIRKYGFAKLMYTP